MSDDPEQPNDGAADAEAEQSEVEPEEVAQTAVAEQAEAEGEGAEAAADSEGEGAEAAASSEEEGAEQAEPDADAEASAEDAAPAEAQDAAAGGRPDLGDPDSDPEARAELKRVLESLIFVSDRTVTPAQLARATKIRVAVVRPVLKELVEEYAERGVQLHEVSGGYQFRSAAACSPWVRDWVAQKPVRLSRAQLETLALVAYRQPITRPEIDDVRGVDTGSAVRVLLDRNLLKILGRKDEPGRPLLYGTSPHFLEFFGMKSLKDLPTLREFTELSEENRALFKHKTGEEVEEAEAALVEAEEAARRDEGEDGELQEDEAAEGQAEALEAAAEGDDGLEAGAEDDADAEPASEADADAQDEDDGPEDDGASAAPEL